MNHVFDTEHLYKSYFKMALPVVLGLIVTLVYNLADTFFIAGTQNTDLIAGVSLCAPVFTALMGFGCYSHKILTLDGYTKLSLDSYSTCRCIQL